MTFRPSQHGWPFASMAAVDAHILGLGAAPAADFGLGGGLCWTALDRYLRGLAIPRDSPAPEPGDPLHAELVRRQVEANSGVWSQVRDWQASPDGSWRDRFPVRFSGGRDVASLTRGEWPRIRRRLDKGEPILLTLLLKADPYRRGRAARQVLATGWKLDDVRVVVSIYDPQRPGDDSVHLSFGLAGSLDPRLGPTTALKGFFHVPYDRVVPGAVRAETFGDRSVLGLNRKIRGQPSPAASRGRLDLVARNADGALIHFQRKHGESWEGANITDQQALGSFELHSDPTAIRTGGLHVFARSYVGDLLHFHLGRSWKVENRTDHKRAGPRFRLVGAPVPTAGPWGLISVLGADKDGGLVHYSGRPLVGWRAEQVAGEALDGDPVAAWAGAILHVVGRAKDGRLLHWQREEDRWVATNLSAVPGADAPVIAGRPALRVQDDAVYVAARTASGRIVVMRKEGEGAWLPAELGNEVVGDPSLTSGPAGTHLFARTEGGGLLHAWRDRDWIVEDVLASRPSLMGLPETTTLSCWGSEDELRLWVRGGGHLWALPWREDSDWTLERLADRAGVADRHRPGDDPVVVTDRAGLPHLFFTDGHGTVLHVEPGDWHEPGASAGTGAVGKKNGRKAAAGNSDAPEPGMAAELDAMDVMEPVAPGSDVQIPEEEARAPRPVPAPASTESGPGPAADLPYLDFEADPPRAPRAEAEAAPEQGEAAELAPEPEAAPEPEVPAGPEVPAEREVPAEPDLEPMDLNLLNTWPPAPKSMRKRQDKESERESS